VATWPAQERELFVATFASRKTPSQIAAELGLSAQGYQNRKREMLRRFMFAARAPSSRASSI